VTTPTSKPPKLPTTTHLHVRHPAQGETTLYLIRHGQTSGNVHGLLHGSTDLPLDALGLRQAHLIAERLASEVEADALLASPLARALATAQIIGQRLGLAPAIRPELSEMDFGELEGVTVARIETEHPELARRMYDLDDDDFAWPGGESRRGFHDRVLRAFQAILLEHPHRRVVVVAHGGVIGSFLAQVHGASPNDWRLFQLVNCSLSHLHVTPQSTAVHVVNDAVHLEVLDAEPDAAELDGRPPASRERTDR
jgi:broad specificity phosphatase PhoE